MSATKICKTCTKRLPLAKFYAERNHCKRCHNTTRKARLAQRPKVAGRGPGRPPSVDNIPESGTSFLFSRMKPVDRYLENLTLHVAEQTART